jgi:hypothetical protein
MPIKYIGIIVLALVVTIWTYTFKAIFNWSYVDTSLIIGLVFILKFKRWYLVWALSCGLFFDSFTGSPFMFYTILFLMIYGLLHYINNLFRHDNVTKFLILSLAAVFSYRLGYILLAYIYSQSGLMRFGLTTDVIIPDLIKILTTFIIILVFNFVLALKPSQINKGLA